MCKFFAEQIFAYFVVNVLNRLKYTAAKIAMRVVVAELKCLVRPVLAPDGTDAVAVAAFEPNVTSKVGSPRESKISRASSECMVFISVDVSVSTIPLKIKKPWTEIQSFKVLGGLFGGAVIERYNLAPASDYKFVGERGFRLYTSHSRGVGAVRNAHKRKYPFAVLDRISDSFIRGARVQPP